MTADPNPIFHLAGTFGQREILLELRQAAFSDMRSRGHRRLSGGWLNLADHACHNQPNEDDAEQQSSLHWYFSRKAVPTLEVGMLTRVRQGPP